MRYFAAILAALLLPACHVEEKYSYRQTPCGYYLSFQNVGSLPDWYTQEELGILFDQAVDAAVLYLDRYGASEELVRNVARAHQYVVFDMPRFATSASNTGWASGMYSGPSNPIVLAFWSRAAGNDVPVDAPPWTVYSWPTRPDPAWDWGVTPHLPALAHEWGHAIWGGDFEHVAGFPTIVNQPIIYLTSLGKDPVDCVYLR